MRVASAPETRRARKQREIVRKRRTLAFILTPLLAFGGLVAGIGIQSALALGPAPSVSVAQTDTYIAGEDLTLTLTFTGNPAAGDQFNVSAGVVMPNGIEVRDTSTLGTPKIYPENTTLRGDSSMTQAQCEALGLEPLTLGQTSDSCRVPLGHQFVVFENISDLPHGAATSHSFTVRPDADLFDVGTTIDFTVTAYTSEDETYLPYFPGSTGVALGSGDTSDPGMPTAPNRVTEVLVNALRIEKSEPSPESELLRGVHDNTTTYTLRIWHTGEGDIENVTVTDFIPAGLEYLGLGGAIDPDRTTNANGTQGAVEYPGASRLDGTPAPSQSGWAGAVDHALNRNAAEVPGETVETVIATPADAAAHPGVVAGDVYTKVTWPIGDLAALGLVNYSILDPRGQVFPDTEGEAGFFEIRYRAAVPLFENTMDFGGALDPAVDVAGEQTANLDNNRGASTRHGHPTGDNSDAPARVYTNVATASGAYGGNTVTDSTSEDIHAVDLRVLKDVDDTTFDQEGIARYTLTFARSEYTTATVPSPLDRPYRLVDDLADGLCPVFPGITPVADLSGFVFDGTADPIPAGTPNLGLGDPNDPTNYDRFQTVASWNAALAAAGVSANCLWGQDPATTDAPNELVGAALVGIAFDAATGHFFVDLELPADALDSTSVEHVVRYSARQNENYLGGSDDGMTTSGDTVTNDVEIYGLTTSIPALAGVSAAGSTVPGNSVPGGVAHGVWNASDDSSETLRATLTRLTKHVLPRGMGVPTAADVVNTTTYPDATTEDAQNGWVKAAEAPFVVGDQVWYRIEIIPPTGTDVRNPKFTDYLPVGMSFNDDSASLAENLVIVPASHSGLGTCSPTSDSEWLDDFAPSSGFEVKGNALIFELGANCGLGGLDRFLPLNTKLTIYIKATVTEQAAFAEVDLPQNLAKYQQNNVDGEIHFLRDDAEIVRDQGVRLTKGIRTLTNASGAEVDRNGDPWVPAGGYHGYNSNIDGATLDQAEKVTFRLDVTAPQTTSTGYLIWDALPEGVRKADLDGLNPDGTFTSATAKTVEQRWFSGPASGADPAWGYWAAFEDNDPSATWTARAYDPGDPGYPSGVRAAYAGRTLVVWEYNGPVPGSQPEQPADPTVTDPTDPLSQDRPTEQGLTLGYTLKVPTGAPGGGNPAQIGQDYVNDASILELQFQNNGSGISTLLINGSTDPVHVASDRTADPDNGIYGFDDEDDTASDPSFFDIEQASMEKLRYATEIAPTGTVPAPSLDDANNPANVIVQGEYVSFDISVTIPAQTTVRDGLLKDDGVLRWTTNPGGGTPASGEIAYHLEDAEIVAAPAPWLPGDPLPADFTFNWDSVAGTGDGSLVFPGAAVGGYTNNTAVDQTFTVRLTVYVDDRDESHPLVTPNFGNGTLLTNTARFTYIDADDDPATLTPATANVTYREPAPSLAKIVSGTQGADGVVVFTLTAGNASGRPALYDAVVYDCLPAGFDEPLTPSGWDVSASTGTVTFPGTSCDVTGLSDPNDPSDDRVVTPGTSGTPGQLIKWEIGRLDGGQSETMSFAAKIDASAGGGTSYTNRAHIEGYTLPDTVTDPSRRGDRATGVERQVPISPATITKSVTTPNGLGSAPIGETVTYTVVVDLPANANFYDVTLADRLPAGVEFIPGQTVTLSPADAGSWGGTLPVVGAAVVGGALATGQTLDWSITPNDITTQPHARSITIEFDARLTTTIPAAATSVTNNADLTWNTVNDGGAGNTPSEDTDDAVVTILNPAVNMTKQVRSYGAPAHAPGVGGTYAATATGEVNQAFEYRLRVTNPTGTNRGPAYNVVVTDVLPTGVVLDEASFRINGNPVVAPNTVSYDSGTRTITWTLAGPVTANSTTDLTYYAEFADSETLNASARQNTAQVTSYESFASGGRTYGPTPIRNASITPRFPMLVPEKTVTTPAGTHAGKGYGIAYAGEDFNWTLTVRNTGNGVANQVSVTDILPVNWEYVDGSARITLPAGGAPVALPDPATQATAAVAGGDQVTVTWTEAQIRAAGASPLAAGANFVITFDTKPKDPEALATPGTGGVRAGISVNPHPNTLSVTATDLQGNDRNALGDYTGPDDAATAYINEADLHLVKEALGGVTAPASFDNLPVGTWIAGQSAVTGYAQPQWQVRVTNQGPDPAVGDFVITDILPATLPGGVTLGSWTARYHSGPADTTGTVVGTFPWNQGTFTIPTTAPLAIDGSNWVSLTANVTIPANALAANGGSLTLSNTASVLGKTFETPANILKDNEDDATKPVAELADLEVRKRITTPGTGVVSVGEQIVYTIDARNNGPSVSRGPGITITDTVPAGLSDVTLSNSADWVVTAINGAAATAAGPVASGDTVTWTFQGNPMVVGTSWTAGVTISGDIERSFTGALVNWAQVHPDLTPDPDYVADPADPGYGTQNNRDNAEITPNDDTRVSVVKTRVVPDGAGGWRQADPATDPSDAFVAGDPVHYRITVTNATGRADAREVTVLDESPEGLTYTGHTGLSGATWSRASGGTNVAGVTQTRWNTFALTSPATLTSGASASFVVSFDTDPTIVGTVINWAEATIENWDRTDTPPNRRDRDDDSTSATRIVDLGIVKSHDPAAPLTPGTEVDYTIVVTNHGVSATNGEIEIVDDLPAGLSFVAGSASVVVSNGTTVSPGAQAPSVTGTDGAELSWSILTPAQVLDVGDTITITYRALIGQKVEANTPLRNIVTVEGPDDSTEPDPDPHPNEDDDTITTTARSADMSIVKTVSGTEWIAGETVSYTLTISNSGPSAVPAEVLDTLPSGLTMISMSGTGWDCSTVTAGAATGFCAYTANDGLHPAGTTLAPATSTITVVARIDAGVPTGTSLVNNAELAWVDSTRKTDDDDASITVTTRADLVLTKRAVDTADADITSATAGTNARYSLLVSNAGPSNAVGPITVVDTLPAGISFVQLLSAGWTASVDTPAAGQVTFTRDPATTGLAAGQTAPVIVFSVILDADLVVTDPADPTDDLVNSATVNSGTPEDDPSNNTDTARLDVTRSSNIAIDKGHIPVAAPGVDEYEVGDLVTFTIDVSSAAAGPSNASGIVVTDTLPEGLEFVGIGGSADWSLVTATLPDTNPTVNPDGTTTVRVAYAHELAPGTAAPQFTVTARVTVDIGDVTSVTNEACVAVGAGETNTNVDPCSDDTIVVVPLADLVILKTAATPAADITAGMPVTWNIAVSNNGPSSSLSSATNRIVVTDEIPAGITEVLDPSAPDWIATVTRAGVASTFPATAGDVITWTFQGASIPVLDPVTPTPFVELSVTGTIDPSWIAAGPIGAVGGGPITNTAEITPGDTRDPDLTNNEDSDTITPGEDTALQIAKNRVVLDGGTWRAATATDPFVPGTDLTFQIDVVNAGPAVARDVRVVDMIPPGLSNPIVSAVTGVWAGTTGVCDGDIPATLTYTPTDCLTVSLADSLLVGVLEARSFLVTFDTDPSIPLGTTILNVAQARATNAPDWPDDTASTDPEPSADLSIAKTALQGSIPSGGTAQYRIVVTNEGPSDSVGPITVTDVLPSGMSYVAGSAMVQIGAAAAVQIEPTGTTSLVWEPVSAAESLPVGETITITLTTRAAGGMYGASLVNRAIVDSPDDNNLLNNEDTARVGIIIESTLIVTKTAVGAFKVGENGAFQITVRNTGPAADPGPIRVVDTLPAGLTFVSSPNSPVTVSGSTVTWTLAGGLGVGQSATFSVVVSVHEAAYPSVVNGVTVETPTTQTSGSQLDASASAAVAEADPLAVTGAAVVSAAVIVLLVLLIVAGLVLVIIARRRRATS